ncbi:MAG: class I SAM-dependent methyltransferase [Candidatus Micrarchaeota archaeon]|nr:class I SAM-dependent methyltransferase [Candidatus Micrarchaeota archaeon]
MEATADGMPAEKTVRLSELERSDLSRRNDRILCENQWRRKPEGFRCTSITDLIRENRLSKYLVVEIGCGDRGFDQKGSIGSGYVGVDISMTALRAAKRSFPRAEFVNADARMLPFRDGSIDVTVCRENDAVLRTDLYHAIREMSRATSGVAIFSVSDRGMFKGKMEPNKEFMEIEADHCLLIAPLKDGRARLDEGMPYFSAESVKSMAMELGLRFVETNSKVIDGRNVKGVASITVFAAKEEGALNVVWE